MDDFGRNKGIVEQRRRANLEKQKAHSKENLKTNIEKKIKTTMIGALDQFEKNFEEEINYNYEKWNLTRTEILNNGNNQIRSALAEIDEYDIDFKRKEYDFNLGSKREILR